MKNVKTVIHETKLASVANYDYIQGRVQWHGGRGFISIGLADSTPDPHATFGVQIQWTRLDLPKVLPGSDGNLTSTVLQQIPATSSALYPFEAPEGELIVGILFTSAGAVRMDNVHILW